MQLLHGERNGGDFLHELRVDQVGNARATRAGNEHARVVAVHAHFRLNAAQELQGLFRLPGLVALVILPENFVGRGIDDNGFHGGGTNVEAHHEPCLVIVRFRVVVVHFLHLP